MAEMLRDQEYWEDLLLESELGVLRYLPPDLDIPIPTEDDRQAVRAARRRYVVASGADEPENALSGARALRDRLTFSEFFEGPEAAQFEKLYVRGSVVANETMCEFAVAVAGVSREIYAAVTYEDMVVIRNNNEYSQLEYIYFVETEYLAATELIYTSRR